MFPIHSGVQSGSLLLDSSTIEPATSQDMEKLAANKGAVYMDAPVSGGMYVCVCVWVFVCLLVCLSIS